MIQNAALQACWQMGCLNEMFIEGKRSLADGAHILAYRSKIWVLADSDYENASKRILSSINKESQFKKEKYKGSLQGKLEDRPDILQATYHHNGRYASLEVLHGLNFVHDPSLSQLVQKVAHALGAREVTTSDTSGNQKSWRHTADLKKEEKPTWGYHGTSTRWLKQILKHGIMPKPENTNFDTVLHEDNIFLTTDEIKAVFHANQACQEKTKHRSGYGEVGYRRNGAGMLAYQPVLLRVKIPDPSRIVADYDIDRESSQKTYGHMLEPQARKSRGIMPGDPAKISKSLGVFGYAGRILPQMITQIQIGPPIDPDSPPEEEEAANNFQTFSAAEILEAFQRAEEHDFDLTKVDLKDFIRMPDEFIQQDQEDEENEDGE